MSRIGKKPVLIPAGVKVSHTGGLVQVHGPKGQLSRAIPVGVDVQVSANEILVMAKEGVNNRSLQGLVRTLIANMIHGVNSGFEKTLEISGVGYRAEAKGKVLNLSLGFSHPIDYSLPEGITVEVEKQTKILVRGIDKELVGATAAKIRSFRGPEPYKGKGIRYSDERILRKVGKAGKK